MNPDLNIEDLEPETTDEDAALTDDEVKKEDIYTQAEDMVSKIIGQNVFDVDLEKNLIKVVSDHFAALPKEHPVSTDIFKIPELNMKIWETYRDYENFVHENNFENIDLNEIAKIIREVVTPEITKELFNLTVEEQN